VKPSTIAVLLALSITCFVKGQGVEAELTKLENQWAQAEVKKDVATLGRILADDFTNTDPDGGISTKSQFISSTTSGEDVVDSFALSDMKIRVYGDTAVVTYLAKLKETLKGKDVSGMSRWTDTWVKRGGSWQCVASHGSKIGTP
jgi:ketosteroid isomerase-like protein